MISNFMELEPEKQERIINAALKEFAQKGYKNASTNEIVKNAGISKGLLFHYFGSKKSLFLFLYNYSWDIFLNDFYSRIDYSETDIIMWVAEGINNRRLNLMKKDPGYRFRFDIHEAMAEFDKYMRILKNAFYKDVQLQA